MLIEQEKTIIRNLVNQALDRAEEIYSKTLKKVDNADLVTEAVARTIPSNIPGVPFLDSTGYVKGSFFSVMADMRDSSKHLRNPAPANFSKTYKLERLYYEVSGLIPVLCHWLNSPAHGGGVTEILGDGVLALFKTEDNGNSSQLTRIHTISEKCIDSLPILNEILQTRYGLIPIRIGIGISFSEAVVQTFGTIGKEEVKAFGECVYRASKLSKGSNEIALCDSAHLLWPKSDGGKMRFTRRAFDSDLDGFIPHRKED